ncbi:MAG: endolytic transglycosylase MltG [Parcubacteria group bacterium]|nr:endolytic transglycosylase MltG [Parcubacteria group bacterium]
MFLVFGVLAVAMLTIPVSDSKISIRINITKGESLREIAAMLQEKKLVRSSSVFVAYVFLRGDATHVLPGVYEIAANSTLLEVLSKITKGPVATNVTLREGMTLREMDALLTQQGIITSGSLFSFKPDNHLKEQLSEFGFSLQQSPYPLEGFLFPDTYRFVPEEGAESVVTKMVANFEDKVGLSLKIFTPDERHKKIIIASLIEKEVAGDYERGVVSGIIERRLKAGMPLQVDASVLYGVCVERQNCDRVLHRQDFSSPSPYNTYANKGLPPSPIANFGSAALRAALAPEPTPYWYYLSTPDGKTFFSKTFKEHDNLRAKYLLD